MSGSDELCIGYVALGRIAFIGVQMLSRTVHMFKNKTLTSRRLLGIFRSSGSRMRQPGKRAASMHGLKGKRAIWTSSTENIYFANISCYRNPQTTPRTRSTSTSPASIPRSSDRTRGSSRRALGLILAYTHSEIGMAFWVYKRGCPVRITLWVLHTAEGGTTTVSRRKMYEYDSAASQVSWEICLRKLSVSCSFVPEPF